MNGSPEPGSDSDQKVRRGTCRAFTSYVGFQTRQPSVDCKLVSALGVMDRSSAEEPHFCDPDPGHPLTVLFRPHLPAMAFPDCFGRAPYSAS